MYVEFIVLGEKTIIQRDRPVAQYNIRSDALAKASLFTRKTLSEWH